MHELEKMDVKEIVGKLLPPLYSEEGIDGRCQLVDDLLHQMEQVMNDPYKDDKSLTQYAKKRLVYILEERCPDNEA